jgi:hypothetical protein
MSKTGGILPRLTGDVDTTPALLQMTGWEDEFVREVDVRPGRLRGPLISERYLRR